MKQLGLSCRPSFLATLATLPPVCILAAFAISSGRVSSSGAAPSAPPPLRTSLNSQSDHLVLVLTPDRLSLGIVAADKKSQGILRVTNHGKDSAAVNRIETSCPCLTVTPSSMRLAPGETNTLTVAFDPSAEPDFRGGLAIDVTGYDGGGPVFRTRTTLTVVSHLEEGQASGERGYPREREPRAGEATSESEIRLDGLSPLRTVP